VDDAKEEKHDEIRMGMMRTAKEQISTMRRMKKEV
jgi:hypothetical protein